MSSVQAVKLKIDDEDVTVDAGASILDILWKRPSDVPVPVLCHELDKAPVGVCRMCVIEVDGKGAAACTLKASINPKKKNPSDPDMVIRTGEQKVPLGAPKELREQIEKAAKNIETSRRTLLNLLMADHPAPCFRQRHTHDCELEKLAEDYGATGKGYSRREYEDEDQRADRTLDRIQVDHAACILCDRCVRACSDLKQNFIIARHGKGHEAGIIFDLGQQMGDSNCVSCMECMYSCPTGALTNRTSEGEHPEDSFDCFTHGFSTTEELHSLELFQHVSGSFLDFNRKSIAKRQVKKGVTLFTEGHFGCTAFYILEGKVDVSIESYEQRANAKQHSSGPFNIFGRWMGWGRPHPELPSDNRNFISIDASRELHKDSLRAQLGKDDVFGEMTCLNAYPRSNTARTATDCVLLEFPRNVLLALKKDRAFRSKLEADYLKHNLEIHLQDAEVFSSLPSDFIEDLRKKAELVRYDPGNIIFEQDKPAEAFYIVRAGFVKVSERIEGCELVLAYLSKGNFFGEIALLEGSAHHSTCSALDHVDLIRIGAQDFKEIIERSPETCAKIQEECLKRKLARKEREEQIRLVRYLPKDVLEEYVEQGLQDAQSLLVLDLNKCTRCDQCVKACADAHDGVSRLVRDGVRIHNFEVATACRHCYDPVCMTGCPVGAIHRQGSLAVVIDKKCIGCGECEKRCPYGNIKMIELAIEHSPVGDERRSKSRTPRLATSCDLCHGEEPRCVQACPHDAAHRFSAGEFYQELFPKKSK